VRIFNLKQKVYNDRTIPHVVLIASSCVSDNAPDLRVRPTDVTAP